MVEKVNFGNYNWVAYSDYLSLQAALKEALDMPYGPCYDDWEDRIKELRKQFLGGD